MKAKKNPLAYASIARIYSTAMLAVSQLVVVTFVEQIHNIGKSKLTFSYLLEPFTTVMLCFYFIFCLYLFNSQNDSIVINHIYHKV